MDLIYTLVEISIAFWMEWNIIVDIRDRIIAVSRKLSWKFDQLILGYFSRKNAEISKDFLEDYSNIFFYHWIDVCMYVAGSFFFNFIRLMLCDSDAE